MPAVRAPDRTRIAGSRYVSKAKAPPLVRPVSAARTASAGRKRYQRCVPANAAPPPSRSACGAKAARAARAGSRRRPNAMPRPRSSAARSRAIAAPASNAARTRSGTRPTARCAATPRTTAFFARGRLIAARTPTANPSPAGRSTRAIRGCPAACRLGSRFAKRTKASCHREALRGGAFAARGFSVDELRRSVQTPLAHALRSAPRSSTGGGGLHGSPLRHAREVRHLRRRDGVRCKRRAPATLVCAGRFGLRHLGQRRPLALRTKRARVRLSH